MLLAAVHRSRMALRGLRCIAATAVAIGGIADKGWLGGSETSQRLTQLRHSLGVNTNWLHRREAAAGVP